MTIKKKIKIITMYKLVLGVYNNICTFFVKVDLVWKVFLPTLFHVTKFCFLPELLTTIAGSW